MSVSLPDAPLDTERLAGLVFELASQLHAERSQRIALQLQLERGGDFEPGWESALVEDPELRARCQAALDDSLARLFRMLGEGEDPRTPLRDETRRNTNTED